MAAGVDVGPWRLSGRVGRFQVVLRVVLVGSVVGAVAATRAAGEGAILGVEIGIVCLAILTASLPDSPAGLLAMGALCGNWVLTVDAVDSPWTLVLAAGLAAFHAAAAAASVAPIGASWTPAMVHRWSRRLAVAAAAAAPVWLVVAALEGTDLPGNRIVVAGALALLAFAGAWARFQSVRGVSSP